MGSYNEYVDTAFDQTFNKNNSYTWLPWIGKDFTTSKIKTLILGESAYNWAVEKESRDKVQDRINKKNHLRILHTNNAIGFNSNSRYSRNIERAMFLKKKPNRSDAQKFWATVAYHNLVLEAMPTLKHRPKYNDYLNGWFTFIELSKTIEIEQCIVYGLEQQKIKSFIEALKEKGIEYEYQKIKPGIGRNYPKVVNAKFNNNGVKILFIRHPSAYFSWKKWGKILNDELDLSSIVGTNEFNNDLPR